MHAPSALAKDPEADPEAELEAAPVGEAAALGRAAGRARAERKLLAGVVALVLGATAIAWLAGVPRHQQEANVGETVGLQASWASGVAPPQVTAALPQGISMPPAISTSLDTYFKEMMGLPSTAVSEDNNNECLETEEMFQGLCYGSCKFLTNGTFPTRTSAWTCCQSTDVQKCFVSNQDKDLGICSGYDVAGDGQSCPRTPGVCMHNEEMFFGQCYEKCSLLTNGTKPHRTSAISCCQTPFSLACFTPSNVFVSPGANAGGGKGDGDASTPASGHAPTTGPQASKVPVAN